MQSFSILAESISSIDLTEDDPTVFPNEKRDAKSNRIAFERNDENDQRSSPTKITKSATASEQNDESDQNSLAAKTKKAEDGSGVEMEKKNNEKNDGKLILETQYQIEVI